MWVHQPFKLLMIGFSLHSQCFPPWPFRVLSSTLITTFRTPIASKIVKIQKFPLPKPLQFALIQELCWAMKSLRLWFTKHLSGFIATRLKHSKILKLVGRVGHLLRWAARLALRLTACKSHALLSLPWSVFVPFPTCRGLRRQHPLEEWLVLSVMLLASLIPRTCETATSSRRSTLLPIPSWLLLAFLLKVLFPWRPFALAGSAQPTVARWLSFHTVLAFELLLNVSGERCCWGRWPWRACLMESGLDPGWWQLCTCR